MPQFDFANVFVPQVFWLAVMFIILYFGVVLPTLPKIGKVMETREQQIASDLENAATVKAKSDEMLAQNLISANKSREDARGVVAKAKASAAASVAKKLAAADAKTDASAAEAQAKIGKAHAKAMAEIELVSAEGAQAIVEKLTGTKIGLEPAKLAVRSQMRV